MAEKYPLANGLWSNAANWDGGTKPLVGDDVYTNGKTLTIDESVTVATLRGTAGAVAVANGQFVTSGTVIITVTNRVYGGNLSLGTLRLSSGATLIGNADTSTVSGRPTVRIDAGATMTGNALNADAVSLQGGSMTGNATGSTSRSSSSVVIAAGGVMTGNSTGGSVGVTCVQIGEGGVHIGNATGGSLTSASGTQALNGGCHQGNSTGGTAAAGTDIRTGGVQIGNATGAASNAFAGTLCGSGGLFFGDATGGGVSGAHGLSISSGFAQVGTATGNTSGAFGVSGTSYASVVITTESGSFAKSLAATVITDTSKYPFASSSEAKPHHPMYQQVIG